MTFCYFRFLVVALMPLVSSAQIVDNYVAQPSINVSWNNNARWSFNSAIEQRNLIENGINGLHLQAAQFASYDIGFYTQIAAGVMYREVFDDQRPEELRFTEQFVYVRKYNSLKLAHRLRWDQRIRGTELTHRWRYRFSGSLPLNGGNIDAREFYLTASVETLFIAQAREKPGYDQRVSLGIGIALTRKLKIQLVTEYRWEDISQDLEKSLFFNLGVYYSL